jgi:hypothetical protein
MSVIGWIDRIDEDRVSGWVHSFEHPSRSERVEIIINGVSTLQVLAHKERADLRSRKFAFIRKGFEFTLSDYTEKAASLVEFIHLETGAKIGEESYTIFSSQSVRWQGASEAERKLVRDVFVADRKYYGTPADGTWNNEPNFLSVADAALQINGGAHSLLQLEPASASFARAIFGRGLLRRNGIVETAEHLRDWHVKANDGTAAVEFHNSLCKAGGNWDIIFLPMAHERSGPTFADILESARAALSEHGLAIFDIRPDEKLNHAYLLTHRNRLLRISSIDEASAEAQRAGLKVVETFYFSYAENQPETKRIMLIAQPSGIGRRK